MTPRGGPTTRDRILEAAVALITESGWSKVTMSRLAEMAGVSRQTVYNEIGSKDDLADAVVAHELSRFLVIVDRAFVLHRDDARAAVRAAALGVLRQARRDPLLRAILAAERGGDAGLLPALTSRSQLVLVGATALVSAHLAMAAPEVAPEQRDPATDVLVRLVLHHVVSPGNSALRAAEEIAWVAECLLR